MPKVRYLSGNQAGAVVDLPEIEAQCAIDTGYAEPFVERTLKEKQKPRLAPPPPAVNPRK